MLRLMRESETVRSMNSFNCRRNVMDSALRRARIDLMDGAALAGERKGRRRWLDAIQAPVVLRNPFLAAVAILTAVAAIVRRTFRLAFGFNPDQDVSCGGVAGRCGASTLLNSFER